MKYLGMLVSILAACDNTGAEQIASCGRACGSNRMATYRAVPIGTAPDGFVEKWRIECRCIDNGLPAENPLEQV
jgi:hypothetical protein